MLHKKIQNPASAILAVLSMFLLSQLFVTPLGELSNGIFSLALFGVLIADLLLGIFLVFLGVFAAYRIIWEQINRQNNKYAEV